MVDRTLGAVDPGLGFRSTREFEGDERSVDSTGAATNAKQPAFRATNTLVSNVTGDGTAYTVVFATEVFDQGSDFDGTSTFTAPVTGRYLLTVLVQVGGMTNTTVDQRQIELVTSNDVYVSLQDEGDYNGSKTSQAIAVIADLDASDTATVRVTNTGDTGGKIHDIAAGEAHFSGILLA